MVESPRQPRDRFSNHNVIMRISAHLRLEAVPAGEKVLTERMFLLGIHPSTTIPAK